MSRSCAPAPGDRTARRRGRRSRARPGGRPVLGRGRDAAHGRAAGRARPRPRRARRVRRRPERLGGRGPSRAARRRDRRPPGLERGVRLMDRGDLARRAAPVVVATAGVAALLHGVRGRPQPIPPDSAVPKIEAGPTTKTIHGVSSRRAPGGGRVRSGLSDAFTTPFSFIQVRVTFTGRLLTRVETVEIDRHRRPDPGDQRARRAAPARRGPARRQRRRRRRHRRDLHEPQLPQGAAVGDRQGAPWLRRSPPAACTAWRPSWASRSGWTSATTASTPPSSTGLFATCAPVDAAFSPVPGDERCPGRSRRARSRSPAARHRR